LICSTSAAGKASVSTFEADRNRRSGSLRRRPRFLAGDGFVQLQGIAEEGLGAKVSKAKIRLPSFIMRRAWALILAVVIRKLGCLRLGISLPAHACSKPDENGKSGRNRNDHDQVALDLTGIPFRGLLIVPKWNPGLYGNRFKPSVR